MNYYEEEVACVHKYLDDLGISSGDEKGNYSLVGRIKQLEKSFYKQLSGVEDYYLKAEN